MPFLNHFKLFPVSGPVVILEDNFTPSGSSVLLESVTPDTTGAGYTKDPSTTASATVSRLASGTDADGVIGPSALSSNLWIAHYGPDPSTADVIIEAGVKAFGAAAITCSLLARAAGSGGAAYVARIASTAASIHKVTSYGSGTQLATQSFTLAAGDTIKFTVSGTSLVIAQKPSGGSYSDIVSTTDSDITTAGKAGIGFGAIPNTSDDVSSNWRIDSLKITQT